MTDISKDETYGSDETLLVGALTVVCAFAIALPLMFWLAYVVRVLWGWYAPAGWGVLGMRPAFGLALGLALIRGRASDGKKRDMAKTISYGLIGPAMVLAAGWLGLFFL